MDDETIRKALEEMARRILDKLEADLFGAQTNASSSPPSSDKLSDLARLRELMAKPHGLATWFIDRPRQYRQVETALLEAGYTVNGLKFEEGKFVAGPLFGISLYNYTALEIEQRVRELTQAKGLSEQQVARLLPFRQPGIWVEMSDGNHFQLVLVQNKLEGFFMNFIVGRLGRN